MGDDTTPVTVLSGVLGAGKTTVLNHVLSETTDRDLAVLVNDMGEVNVDAELVAESSDISHEDEELIELSNGSDSNPSRSAPNSVEGDESAHDGPGSHSAPRVPTIEIGSSLTQGVIEEYETRPNEYTIYTAPDREAALTTWVSASEGSYCSLADAR